MGASLSLPFFFFLLGLVFVLFVVLLSLGICCVRSVVVLLCGCIPEFIFLVFGLRFRVFSGCLCLFLCFTFFVFFGVLCGLRFRPSCCGGVCFILLSLSFCF